MKCSGLRAFMLAVACLGLGPTWLGLILLVWAPLVGLARVAMGVHYVSDVVAGAVVGVIVAWLGLQIHQPLLAWFTSLIGFPLW